MSIVPGAPPLGPLAEPILELFTSCMVGATIVTCPAAPAVIPLKRAVFGTIESAETIAPSCKNNPCPESGIVITKSLESPSLVVAEAIAAFPSKRITSSAFTIKTVLFST